jgi:hypothetical protein
MPAKPAATARDIQPAAAISGATVSNANVNEAEAYGARLAPAAVPDGSLYWKIVNVRHLSADENRGKRNIYVRVLDEAGRRERNAALRAAYTWEGRQPGEEAPPRATSTSATPTSTSTRASTSISGSRATACPPTM